MRVFVVSKNFKTALNYSHYSSILIRKNKSAPRQICNHFRRDGICLLACLLLRHLLFRAAIVRSVWSSKMPLASTPVSLCLLDGPVGFHPAFYIIWARFRIMRRYLAYCPGEEPRISISSHVGLKGMVPCICCSLLLLSWVSPGMVRREVALGLFSYSLQNDDWACSALPSLLFWRPGYFVSLTSWPRDRVFGVLIFWIKALYDYLALPI